jgi:hypothetical protein
VRDRAPIWSSVVARIPCRNSSHLFAPEESSVVEAMLKKYFAGREAEGHTCLVDHLNGDLLAVETSALPGRVRWVTIVPLMAGAGGGRAAAYDPPTR